MTEWDRINIIDLNNRAVIKAFGQYGSGKREFIFPNGISMTQDGHIIVADYNNDRLTSVDSRGCFCSCCWL